jgi:hypothetical protein
MLSFKMNRPKNRAEMAAEAMSTTSKLSVFTQIAICAFLGIFSLFFFETIAYNHGAAGM